MSRRAAGKNPESFVEQEPACSPHDAQARPGCGPQHIAKGFITERFDGDLLPKEFHARAAGVGSGTGAERDVAQSCDGTRLGDGVQVVPGLGRELADALRCARASPRARRAFEPPKNRGGDTGLATFRLTAPNLRAGLRYDDIKIEQNPDVVKALERIPADELVNRYGGQIFLVSAHVLC